MRHRFTALCAAIVSLTGSATLAQTVEIPLIPELDRFGSQIQVVQVYEDASGSRATYGIYDTGASVVTISAADQALFELIGGPGPIPIKVPGGASAEAIGGSGLVIGDVSQPGTIRADGLHAVSIDIDPVSLFPTITVSDNLAGVVPGVQVFMGTTGGSPTLPSIVGTPIHAPSPVNPMGLAAQIGMQDYQLDLGALFGDLLPEFQGITIPLPNLSFVAPGTSLQEQPGITTASIRVAMSLFGADNLANPGDSISYSHNPVQSSVALTHGMLTASDQTFLFDTGAQLSVISTDLAVQLGLNLAAPEVTIDVQGAAGTVSVPGFTISSMELPRIDELGNPIVDALRFRDVPVFVLDIVPGIDGILGMNLFNTVDQMIYDPHGPGGPSASFTFFLDPVRAIEDLETAEALAVLDAWVADIEEQLLLLGIPQEDVDAQLSQVAWISTVLAGQSISSPIGVPEPGTWLLLAVGGVLVTAIGARRRLGNRGALR